MYFHPPVHSDGRKLPADIISLYRELEAEADFTYRIRSAQHRIASGNASPATVAFMAAAADDDPEPDPEPEPAARVAPLPLRNSLIQQPAAYEEWRELDLTALDGQAVPVREWIVPEWLPVGSASLHYAEGGLGKTLLALQLMVACATGTRWCGMSVQRCKSIGLYSEDDTIELHMRLAAIGRRQGIRLRDMADVTALDCVGQDNILAKFNRGGEMVLTPRFHKLREMALKKDARLIIIDTAATTFGGNEIDRLQVTSFVGTALAKLARDINGAVLLNAHPSVSGATSGSMTSGSTAWNGSTRMRWALTRPDPDDANSRLLQRKKANGAALGDGIPLRWSDGAMEPEGAASVTIAGINGATLTPRLTAQQAFLECLRNTNRSGQSVTASANGNYAPKLFLTMPAGRGFNKRQLAGAMQELMHTDIVKLLITGPASRREKRLVIVGEEYT